MHLKHYVALALLLFGEAWPAFAEPAPFFSSEQRVASGIALLGPEWRLQTAPPQDFYRAVYPKMTPRQSPKKRRLFFSDGRSVDLEWNMAGNIDRVSVYDRRCWLSGRRETFAALLRLSEAEEENVALLLSAAKLVFDENQLPGFSIAVAPHRRFDLTRTSKRYGCSIQVRDEPNQAH